ncbi:hypothetical protein J6590_036622 [Homalodisca vitripennis]|nr:hypothetical protein J6590_036622 [Homalodisca vitripennis]
MILLTTFTLFLSISWVSAVEQVIIDSDPGVDDAVALLTTLGDPDINVLAITCVKGNSDVNQSIINTLKTLVASNLKVMPEVYAGSDFGLLNSPPSDGWFGSDGFEDLPYPLPPSPDLVVKKMYAAAFLADTLKANPGKITILAIGPLTNLAVALHLDPNILQQAKRIIILGGSIAGNGNIIPGVEFNFYMDPDAANLVLDRALSSGVLLTIMPMETITSHDLTPSWRWNTLAKIDNTAVKFLNDLEKKQQERHPQPFYLPYDTFAAGIILSPKFVTKTQKLYGFVENRSDKTGGALVVDYFNLSGKAANLEIVTDVSVDALKEEMINNLSNLK